MPPIVVTLVIAVLFGLFAPRRVALVATVLAAAANAVVFVWAVADGKGDDPWWLIPIGIAGSALAVLICAVLTNWRVRRTSRA
jgi:hypothetical protein